MEYPVGVENLVSKLTLELGSDGVVGILVRLGLTSQLISGLVGTFPDMQEVFP